MCRRVTGFGALPQNRFRTCVVFRRVIFSRIASSDPFFVFAGTTPNCFGPAGRSFAAKFSSLRTSSSILWELRGPRLIRCRQSSDTPMARLDSAQRRNLVERYFPDASHQVLILSTDTEVDRQYYQALEPHIARAYHLRYDEKSRATHAEEGYFWEQTPAEPELRSRA